MKIGQSKYRQATAVMIVLVFFAAPFLDSMSCDDFANASPCSGGGIEIRCEHMLGGNVAAGEKDGQPNHQSSPDHVHHFCPICFSIAKSACSCDIGNPLTVVLFKLLPLQIAFPQIYSPVYKPPQN
jgi:hypothetical protein